MGKPFGWRWAILSVALMVLGELTTAPMHGSDRTDVIYLKNGDKLTGEIRLVQGGILQFKCDYGSGRFNIYWDQIERIESKKVITAELSSGVRHRGTVTTSPTGRMAMENLTGKKEEFTLSEVAWMHEGRQGFWGRFDGSLDAGYTLTRSNTTQQLNVGGNLLYNTDNYVAKASVQMLLQSQEDANSIQRDQGNVLFRRMLGKKWFGFGAADFLRSDELELDVRSTLGGGLGKYLRRDFQHSFSVAGGMAWNREVYSDPIIPNQNSPEAVVAANFDFFNLLGNNLDITNGVTAFKSLSRGSRTRLDLNTEMRWSLPKHFYYKVGYSQNFDSSPIGNTSGNDYVVSTGFGWTP